jgi:hypothetical protein
VLAVILFFAAGAAVLTRVDVAAGEREAAALEAARLGGGQGLRA